MRHSRLLATVLAAGLATVATAAPARAQVTFTSETSVKFGGGLGKMVGFAARLGGGSTTNTETSYISGHKMRTDAGGRSTIIDVDAGTITMLDNKAKTYSTMTFEEMAAALDAMTNQAKASYAQAKADAKAKGEAVPDVELKYKVDVENTGETQDIAGYRAARSFMTLTVETRATPEGKSEKEDAGTLVVLVDTWNSTTVPTRAAQQEFQAAYAKRVSRDFRGATRMLSAAFAGDPRIAQALEASGKELQKLPGVSVKSTTYVIGVPPGQKFDRKLALGEAGEKAEAKESGAKKAGKGLFGKLKQAAAAAAAGDEEQRQEQDEKAAPKQGTILTTSTELKEIKAGPVPASLFEVPAEYKKVESALSKPQH
ncbi:MAG: hypothetical protein IRZ00_03675 [Gemmatimonadetes bacterium]|nr:hypothetical protein [Gemmatimonadota bacterium]